MARKAQTGGNGSTRHRSWNGSLVSLLLMALVASASYLYLSQPGRLPLREARIVGDLQQVSVRQVQRQVAQHMDDGFLGVDMNAVRDAVMQLPWVADAGVRREWPDRLRIQVTEQQPLARWGDQSLVNLQGEVFSPDPLPEVAGLPLLQGDRHQAPRLVRMLLRLQSQLPAGEHAGSLAISRLQLNARGEWQVGFDAGVGLQLGKQRVEQRFDDFLRVYPQLLARAGQPPQRIDMRYQHGFTVRWPDGQGVAALHLSGGDS